MVKSVKQEILVTSGKREGIYVIIKRLIDVIGSLFGIILLFPIFLLIALAIKVEDSRGPVFYAHQRLGQNGVLIPVYKFRSMYQNADKMIDSFTEEQKREYQENFKLKDDPRVTKVGKTLRKTSLDELPQLLNVLKGEMSIVGPRPIVTAELEKYAGYEDLLFSVQPGLTGMWQAFGRSDISYEERVQMDVEYINNKSIALDFKIVIYTVISVIKGTGAY